MQMPIPQLQKNSTHWSHYWQACCTPLDGFVSAVRSSSVPVSSRDSRLKDLIAKSDSASERGARHSGVISRPLKRARIVYFHDFNFLMSKLIQLGEELKFQKGNGRQLVSIFVAIFEVFYACFQLPTGCHSCGTAWRNVIKYFFDVF